MKLALLGLLLAAAPAAESFEARVTKVIDGDSLRVTTADAREIEVRLVDIDSPEGRQPYGDAARQALADLVAGRTVRVRGAKTDGYGRLLAHVFAGERDVNA